MSPWPQLERLKARWSQKVRSGPRSDEHTSGTGNKQQIRTGNEDHKRSGNQHQNVAGDEHQRPTGNEHENHLDVSNPRAEIRIDLLLLEGPGQLLTVVHTADTGAI